MASRVLRNKRTCAEFHIRRRGLNPRQNHIVCFGFAQKTLIRHNSPCRVYGVQRIKLDDVKALHLGTLTQMFTF